MLIVIDGPDRVGKSTLMKEVCKEAPPNLTVIPICNKAPSKRIPLQERRTNAIRTYRQQYKLAKQKDWLIVVDRGHYSEAVYGDLYRGAAGPTDWFQHLDTSLLWELIGVPKVVTILHAPPEELHARDDGDSTFSPGGMQWIRREVEYFHRLRLMTKFPQLRAPTAEDLLKHLDGQLSW